MRNPGQKPASIDPLAEKILSRLFGNAHASEIILGGYFALQHYAAYRDTHDIDAWWKTRPTPAAQEAIRSVMQSVARDESLQYHERQFGETVSFELIDNTKHRFSFQIAVRSLQLQPPAPSAWPPVLIESFADNIGAKMNALVDRGAPRDFTDIKQVVDQHLIDSRGCWDLWSRKNPGEALDPARQKMLLHLSGLESRRPLDQIADMTERHRAEQTRNWFRQEFLQA